MSGGGEGRELFFFLFNFLLFVFFTKAQEPRDPTTHNEKKMIIIIRMIIKSQYLAACSRSQDRCSICCHVDWCIVVAVQCKETLGAI